jgi:hypothetical protein
MEQDIFLSDDEGGYLSSTLQSAFWDQENLLRALFVFSDDKNRFRSGLGIQAQRNRSGKIRRRSLQPPRLSSFMHLFNGRQDDALITVTGLNYDTFYGLLELFAPIYLRYTPHVSSGSNILELPYRRSRRGRTRQLTPTIALALVLVWTRTRGGYAALQVIFGLTASTISKYLRFCRRILLLVLMGVDEAQIRMPTDDMIRIFREVIRSKYPTLVHCWGAMDGVKLQIEKPSDDVRQSHFYNGWTHSHYVANLFLFTPDGRICDAYVNSPGTTHDSTMANLSKIYDKVDAVYERFNGLAKIVVDSAFASDERDSLIKSYQNVEGRNGCLRQDRQVNNEATAVRQMAEWGMRGFQSSFPRLKDKIKFEERGERKIMLNLMVYLYNYRVAKVGQNQIRNVYMPYLNNDVNQYLGLNN